MENSTLGLIARRGVKPLIEVGGKLMRIFAIICFPQLLNYFSIYGRVICAQANACLIIAYMGKMNSEELIEF